MHPRSTLAHAARWNLKHGNWHAALNYAITAQDSGFADAVLEQQAQQLVRDQGQLSLYMSAYERVRALDGSSGSELARYWYIWALMFARHYEQAYHTLTTASSHQDRTDVPPVRLRHRLEALRIVILFSLDYIEEARESGRKWLAIDDRVDPFETASVACAVATAAIAQLDFSEARQTIALARTSMSRTNSEYGLAWVSCLETLIEIEQGNLAHADHILQKATHRVTTALGPNVSILSTMALMSAKIALEQGQVTIAAQQIQAHLGKAIHHGFIETTKIGLEVALRCWNGTTESDFAPHQLETIEATFPQRLHISFCCEVMIRMVRLGQMQAALEWEQRHDLEFQLKSQLKSPLSLHLPEATHPGTPRHLRHTIASLQRTLELARIALALAKRDMTKALALTEQGLQRAMKMACPLWQVQLLLTQAQVLMLSGLSTSATRDNHHAMIRAVLRAISIAAPRKLKQVFFDHAELLRPLINAESKTTWALITEQEIAFLQEIRQFLTPQNAVPETVTLEHPTARENHILGLLEAGLSNQDIADRTGLTLGTVKWHLHNLYTKLGVRSRSAAITKARRAGLGV